MRLKILIAATLVMVSIFSIQAAAKPSHPAWAKLDKDIIPAVYYAAKTWKVSAGWLLACAKSEGGLGRYFVSDSGYQDSGWFQFLPGTYEWMSNAAWKAGYKLGPYKTPPFKYKRIDSRLGQAWTAAWAFSHGYSYHWYGSGC